MSNETSRETVDASKIPPWVYCLDPKERSEYDKNRQEHIELLKQEAMADLLGFVHDVIEAGKQDTDKIRERIELAAERIATNLRNLYDAGIQTGLGDYYAPEFHPDLPATGQQQ